MAAHKIPPYRSENKRKVTQVSPSRQLHSAGGISLVVEGLGAAPTWTKASNRYVAGEVRAGVYAARSVSRWNLRYFTKEWAP